MSMQINLSGVVNNDLEYSGQILYQNKPLNLTGLSLTAVLKASRTATDESGTSFTPTVTTAGLGQFTWAVPHADNGTPGALWYRIDVESGGDVYTALFGNLTVVSA